MSLSKSGGRFEVLGRMPGVKLLNGAEVRPQERRDAELRYLQVRGRGGAGGGRRASAFRLASELFRRV